MEVFSGNHKKTDEQFQSGMITWPPPPPKIPYTWDLFSTEGSLPTIFQPPFFRGHVKLGGGFKFFCFLPYLGKIPVLTSIFQLG